MHEIWGERLREVFDSIEDPAWDGEKTSIPIRLESERAPQLKKVTSARQKIGS